MASFRSALIGRTIALALGLCYSIHDFRRLLNSLRFIFVCFLAACITLFQIVYKCLFQKSHPGFSLVTHKEIHRTQLERFRGCSPLARSKWQKEQIVFMSNSLSGKEGGSSSIKNLFCDR